MTLIKCIIVWLATGAAVLVLSSMFDYLTAQIRLVNLSKDKYLHHHKSLANTYQHILYWTF